MERCRWGERVGTVSVRYGMFVAGSRRGRGVELTGGDEWMGVDMALVKADW